MAIKEPLRDQSLKDWTNDRFSGIPKIQHVSHVIIERLFLHQDRVASDF